MIREQALRARQKLVGKLPITGELLRGSLLERTSDIPKTARNARVGCGLGADEPQSFVLPVAPVVAEGWACDVSESVAKAIVRRAECL
jgi:hypothetical protein